MELGNGADGFLQIVLECEFYRAQGPLLPSLGSPDCCRSGELWLVLHRLIRY